MSVVHKKRDKIVLEVGFGGTHGLQYPVGDRVKVFMAAPASGGHQLKIKINKK